MKPLRQACALMLMLLSFGLPASAQLTVSAYELLRETRVTRTVYEYEYRVTATNGGAEPAFQVQAAAASQDASLSVIQGAAQFSRINAGMSAASSNTVVFRLDRRTPWSGSLLNWTFTAGEPPPPISNAGLNQTVNLGTTVALNGSASSDPSGLPLSYAWSITARPSGSTTTLSDPAAVSPTFFADAVGTYVVTLTVNNGFLDSVPSQLTIATDAVPPTANAGPDRTINITSPTPTVMLDGSGSSSPGNLPLTYSWTSISRPAGSNAALNQPNSVMPGFVIDRLGEYDLQLIVNNGHFDSAPDTVHVTASNAAPTASAGADQSARVAQTVQLNGGASSDPNSLPLTFQWSFTSRPQGSAAALSNPVAVNPSFVLDVAGVYVLQLIVDNGFQPSSADTMTVSTELLAPTANAGSDRQVPVNTLVSLDGSASTDPNGLALVYVWSLIHVPAGSAAALSNPGIVGPTFTADLPGEYVAQLIVDNGSLSSAPDTVTITTNSLPPVADAGADQESTAGQLVHLNGQASHASSGLPLTYLWSFVTKPAGSAAALIDATTAIPSFTPDAPGAYVVQLIVNDTLLDSEADTVAIEAGPAGQIALTTVSTLRTYKTAQVGVTLSNPAPPGGLTVGLVSNGGLQAPANVAVPEGTLSASFDFNSGTQAGDFTITATAPGWLNAVANVSVTLRPLSLVVDPELIAADSTVPGQLILDEPAPTGGITFTVSSNNVPVASPIPTAVFVAEGESQGSLNVDGGNVGVATLAATAPGYASASDSLAVTNRFVLLPEGIKVGVGQTLPFSVSISEMAAENVTVTLSGFDPAILTVVPAQVVIPAGATQPAVLPQITGVGFGVTTITGDAPGHISDSEAVATTLTPTFSPSTISVVETNTRDVTLNLSAPAPAAGLTVNLSSADEAVATLPPTAVFPGNTSTVTITITGEAPGSTTIRASAPNIEEGALAVTVTEAPGFILTTLDIGKDLQRGQQIRLEQAAPAGNLQVTLTSDDPARLLFSLDRLAAGSSSVTVTVNAGSEYSAQPVYFQALAAAGTSTYSVTAPGYKKTTGTVNLTPSGLAFTEPSYIGYIRSTFATTLQAGEQQLGVRPIRLAAGTLNFGDYQELRGGLVLPVELTSSDPSVGTVPATLNLDLSTAAGSVHRFSFTPLAGGTTTLTVTPPAGWSVPSQYPNMVVTVTAASLAFYELRDTVIGRDLQTFASGVRLDAPAPPGGVVVTLETDSQALLLTRNGNALGTQVITFNVAEGGASAGAVYIQALGSTGTANITMSAPGYQTKTVPITLAPSGMVLGLGVYARNTIDANTLTGLSLEGAAYRLDPGTGATSKVQTIRGGYTVEIGLTSSQPAIGTVPSTVSFTGDGNGYGPKFTFSPLAEGSTVLTVTQPTGWQTPSNWASLTVNVSAPSMSLVQMPVRVGRDLQFPTTLRLAAAAPTGGTTATITSQSPSLLLSTVRAAAGSSSITLDIQQGQTQSAAFYVQSLSDSGTATITLSAPRFATGSFDVMLVPSTVTLGMQTQVVNNISLTTLSGNRTLSAVTWPLNSSTDHRIYNSFGPLELRGGLSLPIAISNSDPAVGGVTTPLPIQVAGGATSPLGASLFTFLPATAGTTVLTPVQPPGFVNSTGYTGLTVTVTAPTINIGNHLRRIGSQLQRQMSISLQTPAPSGGLTVTLTSGNPNLLLSTSNSTIGSNSIAVSIPQGMSSGGTFYIQGLASSGQATVVATAPGYQTRNEVFELVPSTIEFSYRSISRALSSGVFTQYIFVRQLDPATLNVDTNSFLQPSLRPGSSLSVAINNSNPGVATVPSPAILNPPGDRISLAITPLAVGTTVLTPVQPIGFTTPSSDTSLTVNIN